MNDKTVNPTQSASLTGYMIGFLISLVLTLADYLLVNEHVTSGHLVFPHGFLVLVVAFLAIAQLVVQLVCFLHIGREAKPRWNLLALLFAALVVVILVFGSLWIMQNLNYHHDHGSPSQINQYIIKDEGIPK